MKIGDRVKIVNPNSSFCYEEGVVIHVDRNQIDVHLDGRDDELMFYRDEVRLVK